MNGLVGWISLVCLIYLVIFPHELAHALVAKAEGLRIKNLQIGVPDLVRFKAFGVTISLGPLLIRGKLDTEEEAADISPRKWIALAGAGPLANICIAFSLLLLIYLPYELRHMTIPTVSHFQNGLLLAIEEHDSILGFLAWELGVLPGLSKLMLFSWVSVMIGLSVGFGNLTPIPPLDGGWILVAVIDLITGRRTKVPEKAINIIMGILTILGILFLVFDLIITQIL